MWSIYDSFWANMETIFLTSFAIWLLSAVSVDRKAKHGLNQGRLTWSEEHALC